MFPIMGATNPTGYNLTRSLRFRSSASAYLNRTYVASPTDYRKYTFSTWVKLGALGVSRRLIDAGSGSDTGLLNINSDGTLEFTIVVSGSGTTYLKTNNVLRDPSAWYHIVFSCDTSVGSSQFKFYVNNVQASYSTNTAITINYGTYLNSGSSVAQLGRSATYAQYFDGYLTEVNFIDGQALTPSSFGETDTTTGVWKPKAYAGTYGTNGFELQFTDNSALTTSSNAGLGKDFSGNGNYWTTNNISITSGTTYDSMTDVPTLTSATAANYCVMNPLQLNSVTLSNGNLTYLAGTNGSLNYPCGSTLGVSSGKFYWEITVTSLTLYLGVGIASTTDIATLVQNNLPIGFSSASYSVFQDGNKCNNSSTSAYQTGGYTTGDVIGVAFDATNGKIWFSKNNTFPNSGDPVAGTNAAFSSISANTYLPALSGNNSTLNANFGQRPFSYTPPTGYVALNTYNLPTSTILQGNTVMDATLYTGNASTNTITNAAGFRPDFVWYKARALAYSHQLFDSVRGVTKRLVSNSTAAENTQANYLTSFNSNGFTIGNDAEGNTNASSYVAWQWQAGQGTTSSNTSGTITSTVSVNASAGFSIATCTTPSTSTNFTVGHGLGVAPAFMIVKNRTSVNNWTIYHQSTGATGYLLFNTVAFTTNSDTWANTAPTSTVWSSNTSGWWATNQNLVAYCWTPIAGYSAFGSYTGNGSTDGPMVYTGFQPKWIMIKQTSASGQDWQIQDTTREPYNDGNRTVLWADLSNAEVTDAYPLDVLSNGFKIRNSGSGNNASGATYIYAAFATSPFKNSLAF